MRPARFYLVTAPGGLTRNYAFALFCTAGIRVHRVLIEIAAVCGCGCVVAVTHEVVSGQHVWIVRRVR